MSFRFAAPGLLVLGLLLPTFGDASAASEGEIARRSHAFARQVMSPYCPGRTLADCPSPDAALLRQQVRTRLAAGRSEAEILSELERTYGDVIRPTPSGPWPWLGPLLLLGGGLAGVAFVILRARRRPETPAHGTTSSEASSALERTLEAELRERGL